MTQRLPDALLRRLSERLAQQFGLHFPEGRWRELERCLVSVAREFDRGDAQSCLEWLLSSPLTRERIEILASHLTVGETYFFRDLPVFEALESRVLPELIASRRATGKRLRIWSAGCATGEEPYSVAILLHRLLGDAERDWNLALLATDIDLRALRKASEGIYGEWSFRNAPPWLKEGYFRKVGKNRFAIAPSIREKVTFAFHNLVQDPYPSVLNNTNAMDIILCRNVVMYITPQHAARVFRNFHGCLLDDGWLVASSVEASAIPFPEFARGELSGVAVFRKGTPAPEPFGGIGAVETGWTTDRVEPPSRPPEGCPAPVPIQPEPSGDAESLARSAKFHADRGDLGKALDDCQAALALDRLNPEHHYLEASILQEQNRLDEAAAALKRALYLDPRFVLAHLALAHLAKRRGKSQEAQKHAEHALALLRTYSQEAILPRSEGLTAGRLMALIQAVELRGTVEP